MFYGIVYNNMWRVHVCKYVFDTSYGNQNTDLFSRMNIAYVYTHQKSATPYDFSCLMVCDVTFNPYLFLLHPSIVYSAAIIKMISLPMVNDYVYAACTTWLARYRWFGVGHHHQLLHKYYYTQVWPYWTARINALQTKVDTTSVLTHKHKYKLAVWTNPTSV